MRTRFRVAQDPKVQMHLSTCVVLMMVFGAMIGMNMRPDEIRQPLYKGKEAYDPRLTPRQASSSEVYLRGYRYGFPMPVYTTRELICSYGNTREVQSVEGEFQMPWLSLPFNLAVWLGIMTAGAFAMEEYNHNRKRAYKMRPREADSLTPERGGVECPP